MSTQISNVSFRRVGWLSAVLVVCFWNWLFTGQAGAVSVWDGSDDSNWGTAANWDTAPGVGDDLIFTDVAPTFLPTNNDIVGGDFGGITFNGDFTGPLAIGGNAFSLGASGITQNNPDQVSINVGVTLSANSQVTGSGTLLMGSTVSGVGVKLTKDGAGTLIMNVGNTFSGGFDLLNGSVRVNNNTALGSGLVSLGTATIGTQTINDRALSNDLSLDGDTTFGDLAGGTGGLTLSGAASLTGTRTFTVNNFVTFSGAVTETSPGLGIIKQGAATLTFTNANNDFSGPLTIDNGTVQFNSIANIGAGNSALGAPTTVVDGTITINGGGLSYSASTAQSTDRPIVLTAGSTISVTSGSGHLTLNGDITGSVGLTKGGSGTLRLTGENTFSSVAIPSGVLEFDSVTDVGGGASALGSVASGEGQINLTGSRIRYVGTDPAGHTSDRRIAGLAGGSGIHRLEASGVGTLTWSGLYKTGAGGGSPRRFRLGGTGEGIYTGLIQTGGADFGKEGSGTWTLASTQTGNFSTTFVSAGTLILANNNTLAATGSGTVISDGATLGFINNINYSSPEPISVIGAGDAGNSRTGAITNISGTNRFTGPITLTGNATIGADAGQLTLTGLITEDTVVNSFQVTKNGPGTVVFDQVAGNTYQGGTLINAGTLFVNNLAGSATGSGDVIVGADGTLAGPGIIGGATTVSGTISPGASPGVLTFQDDLTFEAGSEYVWEINDALGDSSINYDTLDITGTLAFNASAGDPFVLSIETLDLANLPGEMANFHKGLSHEWLVATATGGITGLTSSNYTVNFSGFQNQLDGTFALMLANGDTELLLTYTPYPIPEPGTLGLLGLGIVLLAKRRRGKLNT